MKQSWTTILNRQMWAMIDKLHYESLVDLLGIPHSLGGVTNHDRVELAQAHSWATPSAIIRGGVKYTCQSCCWRWQHRAIVLKIPNSLKFKPSRMYWNSQSLLLAVWKAKKTYASFYLVATNLLQPIRFVGRLLTS